MVLLTLAIGAFVGYLLIRAKADSIQASVSADFQAGQSNLDIGKALLKKAASDHAVLDFDQALVRFRVARGYFNHGADTVDHSRLIRLGELVPIFGGSIQAKHDTALQVATMGSALSMAASDAVAIDRTLLVRGQASGGERLLTVLRDMGPALRSVLTDLRRAQRAAGTANPSVLSGPQRSLLTDARQNIQLNLDRVKGLTDLVPALIDILGGNGQRTYIIEQVNPSELRSGGGFLGTISIMTADKGILKLPFSGDVTEFDLNHGRVPTAGYRPPPNQPNYVRPPGPLIGFYGGQSWSLPDSNFFPDFQTNARWAEFFANQRRETKADGVIGLDYYAVASLLDAVGPIHLPEFGITLDSKNFVREVVGRDLTDSPTHKTVLSAAAAQLIGKISELPPERWPSLITAMNEAEVQRHLQVVFNSQANQQQMNQFGWIPALNPHGVSDFLLESEDNMGGTKANFFLSRRFDVTLTKAGTTLHHRVVVDLDEHPNRSLTGAYPIDHYNAYVRFYTGRNASNLKLIKASQTNVAQIPSAYPDTEVPSGYKVSDGWIFLTVKPLIGSSQMQLVFEYDTPWESDSSNTHAIYWQKQPGTVSDPIAVTWMTAGKTFRILSDLSQDRVLRLEPNRVSISAGEKPTAQLPGLTF